MKSGQVTHNLLEELKALILLLLNRQEVMAGFSNERKRFEVYFFILGSTKTFDYRVATSKSFIYIETMPEKASELIKILIIEDNRYMREGWSRVLDSEPDFVVLDTFESCEEAFDSNAISKANIALMDIGLPGMSGIEGVKYIQKEHPDVVVIIATVFDDDKNVFDAICSGAMGYLMKKVSPDELKKAIRDANNGGSPMTPDIARKVIKTFHTPSNKGDNSEQLNDRELEILEQLAKGKPYAAIGKAVHLSVDGVRYHIRNIYRKLQVHSRSEAVSKGISRRLIDPHNS